MKVSALRLAREVEHPAGREHVGVLGVDVAGGDVLHDLGGAAALGVDHELGVRVLGAHVGDVARGGCPAWTWHSPSQTCMRRPVTRST